MKYSQWIGVGASLCLVISCMINWTWYPDIHKYFTAFSSEDNIYGKPGKVFIFLAGIAIFFYVVPRIWAKRWNLFICCLVLAYAIKSFILFSACYRGICPEKQFGIWLMLGSAVVMMICSLLPDLKINKDKSA